ncbi:hypothetical protein EON82_00425 [bacterium]|nr:MAG: hypothetical protein EON82_00425 [bacterium]
MVLTTLYAALAMAQQPAATTIIQSPKSPTATTIYAPALARVAQDKRVSVNFNNASLKDVVNFLRKEKIDFVIDPDQFKDRRLTVSLSDVSTSTALSAIANALDAHWERVGDVRVLKRGGGFGPGADTFFRSAPGFATPAFPRTPDVKFFEGPKMDKKAFEEMQKAMEKAQKEMKFEFKDFKGLDKAQQEEVRKALEGARKDMDKARKDMERSRIEFRNFDGARVYGLDKKQLEELRANGKAFDGARVYGLDKKTLEELRANGRPLAGRVYGLDKKQLDELRAKTRSLTIDGTNIGDVIKSLTPAQKEIQKKQGYLKSSDLTPEQCRILGITGEGSFDITIVRDGETIKIKSN